MAQPNAAVQVEKRYNVVMKGLGGAVPGWNTKRAFSAHEYFMTNPSLSGRGHKAKDRPRAIENVGKGR